MTEYALGRIYVEDPRDLRFPMATVLADVPPPPRPYRYWWDFGWWGNQNRVVDPDGRVRAKPWCVTFMGAHYLEDGPETYDGTQLDDGWCRDVYHWCQRNDMWEGEDYDGTSERAMFAWMLAQGLISSYRHTRDVRVLAEAVWKVGPVGVGTNWYDRMFTPHLDGGFLVPAGDPVGGHAWLINGVNFEREVFRMKNSWGRVWGDQGRAWITFAAMQRLLDEWGNAVLAVPA